ncbi:MAG TPA: hypothetical protein VIY73_06020, partial [Polyangiaceae bacterium]
MGFSRVAVFVSSFGVLGGRRAVAAAMRGACLSLAVVALSGGAVLAGCDRDDVPSKPVEPAPVASIAASLGLDASDLEPPVDPPAPAGDLEAELAAFTTVDACTQQRAGLDPVVGDALEAIGYDTLVRDACRLLDAAKAQDAKRCAAIDASPLRERCEALVAELAGDGDACPFEIPTRPEQGRQASCLALAARDVRLCAGAFDASARATCEAIATRNAAPCKHLGLRSDQARCARDEKRFAAALPAATAPSGAALVVHGKATLGGASAAPAVSTAPSTGDAMPLDVARGVVLLERIDGTHLTLGSINEGGPSFVVPSPNAPATV